ncbi:MAG: hypothetical protein WAV95_13980 [Azonexus sp.]
MRFSLIYCLVGLLIAVNCSAAGFNCEKATGEVEKMICDDQELSQLDDVLLRTYKVALTVVPAPSLLQADQKRWLTKVRNRCKNTDCLVQSYETRISRLEQTWEQQVRLNGLALSKANADRTNPFEGEWKTCQLWKGEEICSSYVLVQNKGRVCGEWEYWATYRTYDGQLQASSRTANRADLELICGTPGSEAQTPCDNDSGRSATWEKAKGGLVVCDGRLFAADQATPCTTLIRSKGFLYRPLTAKDRNRLLEQSWVTRCLGDG